MSKDHGLAIMIGVGKPRPATSAPPPPKWDDEEDSPSANPTPGKDATNPMDSPDEAKISPEEAGAYTSSQKCSTCEYYIHPTHECQKVEGTGFGVEIVGCQLWEPEDGSDSDDSGEDVPSAPAPQGDQYGPNTSTSGQ